MIARRNQVPSQAFLFPIRQALRRLTPLLVGLSALFVFGCALTSKSESILPRYFSPERTGAIEKPAFAPVGLSAELRVGNISAASHLDERMVFRDSAFELGYYQEKRWTEAPEEYLRRRLERALFEERGLRHVVGGSAPTLVVELTAFEEIRKPKRIARVQVSVRLQDARLVRWEETLTVDQPVAASNDEELANGMVEAVGLALFTVVNQIADRVTKELEAPPVASIEHSKKAGP
jgi:cholesterol transport system auxiliary component